MTQTQLLILFIMGGLLLCVMVLFGWYIFSDLNSSNSVAVIPPTSTTQPVQPSNTPILLPTFTTTPTNIPTSILDSGGDDSVRIYYGRRWLTVWVTCAGAGTAKPSNQKKAKA